jgi:Amt family ammonium transporter
MGLRVSPEEEDAGLDISEHGMYGYPEQFIPQPEYSTGLQLGGAPAPAGTPAAASVSQMTTTDSA